MCVHIIAARSSFSRTVFLERSEGREGQHARVKGERVGKKVVVGLVTISFNHINCFPNFKEINRNIMKLRISISFQIGTNGASDHHHNKKSSANSQV